MRENRQSGSAGGEAGTTGLPYPDLPKRCSLWPTERRTAIPLRRSDEHGGTAVPSLTPQLSVAGSPVRIQMFFPPA